MTVAIRSAKDRGDAAAPDAVRHDEELSFGEWQWTVTLLPTPKFFAEHESLRPLFASRKVAFLLQEIRRNGNAVRHDGDYDH